IVDQTGEGPAPDPNPNSDSCNGGNGSNQLFFCETPRNGNLGTRSPTADLVPLVEGHHEPRDPAVRDRQAQLAGALLRIAAPGIAGDDRVAVAARVEHVELVVRRLLAIRARDRVAADERTDGEALERHGRILRKVVEHAREVAGA